MTITSFFNQLHKLFGSKPIPHYTVTASKDLITVTWKNNVSQLEILFTERDDIEHILRYTNYNQPELSYNDYTFTPYSVWYTLNKRMGLYERY